MNYYTTLNQIDFTSFKKSWLVVINKEIDLFLLMVKKELMITSLIQKMCQIISLLEMD